LFLNLNLVSIGQLVAFWGVFSILMNSLLGSTALYLSFIESNMVIEKLNSKINLGNKLCSSNLVIRSINEIKCHNVIIDYPFRNEKIVLPSFNLSKGEWVVIRGKSGRGKTTLLRLILGLLEPSQGCIQINGNNFSEIDYLSYMQKIGYVEQNGYLYSRNLKDNILLGREYKVELLTDILKSTKLTNFFYSTEKEEGPLIGENGLQISGGEKQKILIARALYGSPEWLFLDEPFNGVDINDQYEIKCIIESLKPDLTVVIITHNENPFVKCDKTISLI
jgi:ABC-type bacteriocin/lantibiotic exporter with double-glycine peptidase domain